MGGESSDLLRIIRITITAQVAIGVILAVLLAAVSRILAQSVLNLDSVDYEVARVAFLLTAGAAPIITVGAAFRGFLEAAQRFRKLSIVRGIGSTLTYLLPAGAVLIGRDLISVVVLLIVVRIFLLIGFWAAARDLMVQPTGQVPEVKTVKASDILSFGGWTTISTVVSPILVYVDRFLLGVLVSVGAVGLYTAPFELVVRVLLVPGSIAATLFPAVSSFQGQGRGLEMLTLAKKASAAVAVLVAPFTLVLLIYADPILKLWLGPNAVSETVIALQILAPGVLANSLAFIPFSVLQGVGRADLTGKLHLIELPIHILLAWVLISRWGITGAAAAWTIRTTIDAALLFYAASKVNKGIEH
jgi:O-antigen/teichoic acid export membrane protein